jgi:hypothetical protein
MTLNPAYLQSLRAEQAQLSSQGMSPQDQRVQAIVAMWRTACPRLVQVLQAAGVLDVAASVLDHQVLQQARQQPGDYQEARQLAERELIPFDPMTEAAFLNRITSSGVKTTG